MLLNMNKVEAADALMKETLFIIEYFGKEVTLF